MSLNLLNRFSDILPKCSKRQRIIAEYILDNYKDVAFMTAAELAEATNVSESTVVRFAIFLGFEGYPEMSLALREMIKNKLTAVQRIDVFSKQLEGSSVLQTVLRSDRMRLKATMDTIGEEEFEKATELITNAENVYIIGVRSASALANFAGFYLNLMLDNVKVVNTTSASEMFEQLIRIGEKDLLIAITYPRYSQRTVKAARFAKEKGSSVLAITDNEFAPVVPYSDTSLLARSDMLSFVDSLVAPLSLINALVVAVSLRKKSELTDSFTSLEKIWKEYDVYETNDQ